MSIFKDNAPKYWAAGLPVMPLRPSSKVPSLSSWQSYATRMPDADEQAQWLAGYPEGNLGMPLGPQSGIVALDLDTDDPRVRRILDKCMPHTPWVRVGKKGAVYAFKYNGEKIYRIKDEDGNTIMELLSRGAQIVLPPSIHPDTKLPYEANCELVDVLDKLPTLPAQFERMVREALIEEGFKLTSRSSTKLTEWVPSGGRDSALTAVAGLTARSVMRGERPLIEALHEVEVWCATFTERVVGDQMEPEKARQKLMEFVRRDILEHNKALPPNWSTGMTPEEIIECRKFFGEDVEEWSYEAFVTYLRTKFTEIPREDTPARVAVVEEVLSKVARAQALTETQTETILQFISSANGRMLTMAALRKQLKNFQGGELEGNDHTEIAQHLIKELERYGELRYASSNFYQWRGSHWEILPVGDIMRTLAENFGKLTAARRHSDHKGILQTVANLVPRDLKRIDIHGINFANGFLTNDMELRDHDPKFGATYCLPFRYMPEQGAPVRFLSLLDQCWGGDEDYAQKVQALREAIAATLFGMAARYARAFCLFGVAHSGKTTISNIIMGLTPSSTQCSVPPHEWGDRFQPSEMANKLVNRCGELSESQFIQGDRFKLIVEGSEINGQFKGQDIFKFRPTCSHWFASNHLPRTRDTSNGFNRRWLFWHFTRAISSDMKIDRYEDIILAEEAEAIAAWAVPAIEEVMRQADYTLPQSHKDLISEVASHNNSIRFFLASGAVQVHAPSEGTSNQISETQLYQLYYAFCKVIANAAPVQLKRFRLTMMELQSEFGFQIKIARSSSEGELATYVNLTPAKQKKAA